MSEKRSDKKNRYRSKTIAFRVSPEEGMELDKRWKLCGASCKREYILESVMNQQVVVRGNPMMITQFRKELREIVTELERIDEASEIGEELFTPVRTMLEILEGFRANQKLEGISNV